MPKIVKSIVITGNGTNCEMEMAHACRLAGSDEVDIVHISMLLYGEKSLDDYHFLNLPGGFLDGDDLGSAKAGANRILHAGIEGRDEKLYDQFARFIAQGKLILGVCNGFQLLVKLGMLPGFDGDYRKQTVTLTFNDSGRFEDRWVYLRTNILSPCIFTRHVGAIYLPVRHGEGKFIAQDEDVLERLHDYGHVAIQYSHDHYADIGKDLRPHAPSGGLSPLHQPSPLDPGETSRRGDGAGYLQKCRQLSQGRLIVKKTGGCRSDRRRSWLILFI
jgi:phosphoribosylformylglycinamidine (FGAM) synthase-like amidotransferase family enzyme